VFIFSERMHAFVTDRRESMFCTQCGAQLSNGVNFCPSCGNNLRAAAEATKASPNSGPQTFSAVEPQHPQAHAPEPISLRDPQSDPRASEFALRRRIKTAAVGGAFALILAAAGYWTWSNFAPRSGGGSAGPAANSVGQRDANIIAAPDPGPVKQRDAGIVAARDSGEQAEIAAGRAALDREIAAEESEARERASRSAPK
jgi:predicted RNA-binding Zn-ribbon protein involved in translation (DUF1610 family)